MSADGIAIYVVSANGMHRYAPVAYRLGVLAGSKASDEMPGGLSVIEYDGDMSYQYLNICEDEPMSKNAIFVDAENAISYLEGWAVNSVHGDRAEGVAIQVEDRAFQKVYGKLRQTVADIF